MRGRSYSYSPSPPRYYGRRDRSPFPRGQYSHGREGPTSLLVRNLRHDCRPEDLRGPFGRFGPIKDIYLPRDYHTGRTSRLKKSNSSAKYEMDGYVLLGRELTVVFAEENRKKPSEMRARDRTRGGAYERGYSSARYASRSPCYARSYSRSPDFYSPRRRHYSRSISPRDVSRSYRGRSYSRSPYRSPYGSRSRSKSPNGCGRNSSLEYSR